MFCEKCGAQLPDNANFCTSCGSSIENNVQVNQRNVSDTEIQLKVMPTYSFGYMVLPSLIFYSIIILIPSLIVCAFNVIVGIIIALVFFLVFALLMGIKVAFNKKQYDNYSYSFYKTKVIYRDSFLNVSEKEVKYKYIREVAMRQTFIQRYFDLGNIVLFTNAETGLGNGIFIPNVKNVQDIYRNIKSIINV